jgi:protein-S-isoprenylcysteine O-methyltransferase Ste14
MPRSIADFEIDYQVHRLRRRSAIGSENHFQCVAPVGIRKEESVMVKLVPLIGVIGFLGIGVVWRSWVQQRRYGGSGFALFRSRSWAQHVREALIIVLAVTLLGQAAAAAWAPQVIDGMRCPWFGGGATLVGTALMAAGIAMMAAAQLDMGASWRIGVDIDARPGLVVGGLYRFSRNPIYLAMLAVLLGFALVVPTGLSWVLFVGTLLGIRRQVHAEEAHLRQAYGAAYAAYAAHVGRFVPGMGRLRPAD